MTIDGRGMGLEGADLTVGGFYGTVRGVEVAAVQLWVKHHSGVDVLVVLMPQDASELALRLIQKATEAHERVGGDFAAPRGGVQ